MKYREIKADGFLSNFIECFWEYENTIQIQHCIIPDGCFDLIAEYENEKLTQIKLTGVWTKPVNITLPKSTKLFAIRFKLISAEYIFQKEIKSILEKTQCLPINFWGIDTLKSDDLDLFAANLLNQIIFSINDIKKIDERKISLFNLIYEKKIYNVSQLSESTFWNSRQINRYFYKQFGFPLKTLLNIMRCNETYPEIANKKLYNTNQYTDQAHYIKEIKKYTGSTPRELAKNENDRFLQLSTLIKK
ncbi:MULTISPECIES: DUF6597 domain-containing transcriptional factor [Flavobacterium]|uniref:AraC family transcriptional regulator n=1 Tax=Flavobacterium salmonis TaxID=2654844 RepID=A0A6V6YVS7_9FLAO|nr:MULTISPECIES: DUF6597 domain-containing transcriptional factor [Flavobacterium]OOV17173.1 AraC family transcriptional regulator [Flavobacterium sp. LM4]CAD0003565.1 AraC family transcriptional regulator [Flavobacterium salmonis]